MKILDMVNSVYAYPLGSIFSKLIKHQVSKGMCGIPKNISELFSGKEYSFIIILISKKVYKCCLPIPSAANST